MEAPDVENLYLSVEAIPSVKPIASAIPPNLPPRDDLELFVCIKD
jgi:hypothetical protein